ncbi:MAG: hypothetical protein KBT36_08770 [Kurthia sp.]|nr:hypothetical protein [Candidatus Kurthia equi]
MLLNQQSLFLHLAQVFVLALLFSSHSLFLQVLVMLLIVFQQTPHSYL